MLINVAMLVGGLALLTFGADYLVRGAISLANRFGMPPLLIGLTVVGFGTSMPELLVSLQAALAGKPALAIGNVVGSNTANILLILGVSATITAIAARIPNLGRDLLMMIFAAVVMLGLGWLGVVNRLTGAAMFAILVAYLIWVARANIKAPGEDDEDLDVHLSRWIEIGFIIGGLAALFVGASLLIDAATEIAQSFGISEAVIGLTIVAIGTSLPELATSVVAAFRRHAEVALGNVVGSNIFNILGILGITAVVTPMPVDAGMASFDIPLMLAVSVALALLIRFAGQISRLVGLVMLALYAGYIWYLFLALPPTALS